MLSRAAVFTRPLNPFQRLEIEQPKLEPRGLLLRVSMMNVCGSDLHIWKGEKAVPRPLILGHEAFGQIEKAGEDLTKDAVGNPVSEGDRVVYQYFYHCENCYQCVLQDYTACSNRVALGVTEKSDTYPYLSGGMAEHIYIRPRNKFFKVPEDLKDEEVSPINCALSTIINAMSRADLKFGEKVLIMGAGGLGLYACSVADKAGASKVMIMDLVDSRLRLAEEFGASTTLNPSFFSSEEKLIEEVRRHTGGWGLDLVLGVTGSAKLVETGLRMLRKGGRFVEVGTISDESFANINLGKMVYNTLRLVASLNYETWCLQKALEFVKEGRDSYPFKKIVSHKFPLGEADKAFEVADSKQAVRVAIVP